MYPRLSDAKFIKSFVADFEFRLSDFDFRLSACPDDDGCEDDEAPEGDVEGHDDDDGDNDVDDREVHDEGHDDDEGP